VTLQGWAERVLLGTTLDDKCAPPSGVDRPSAFALPALPGRPPPLAFGGTRGEPPRPGQLRTDVDRGRVLHVFANHELLALELMALAILRFPDAPPAFRRGLAGVAREEQEHLGAYLERMADCGVALGDAPVSSFFWDALAPVQDLGGFVAGISLTLEQANLDFSRDWAEAFEAAGDAETAAVLRRVHADEIRHVRHGLHWLRQVKDPGESDLDAYQRKVVFPLGLRRARGTRGFDRDGRLSAGLDTAFVQAVETAGASRGRAPRVFLFEPGVEAQVAGESPGRVARQLAADLDVLPLVFAGDDDVVVVGGPVSPPVRAQWVAAGLARPEFVVGTDALRDRAIDGLSPWGWSPQVAERLRPWGARWDPAWRPLFAKPQGLEDFPEGPWVAKAPWSTSGSDRIYGAGAPTPPQRAWVDRMVRRQGRVVIEPWLTGVLDLSVQLDGGRVLGVTRFATSRGAWRGSWIGRFTDGLPPGLRQWLGRAGVRELMEETGRTAAAQAAAVGYHGPLGVDGLVHRTPDGLALRPCLEWNPRFTMGRVALALQRRQAAGAVGWFHVERVPDPAAVAGALPTALRRIDGKVSDGVVVLNDWQRARQFLALWWAAPNAAALCARWDALREDPRLAQVIPRSTDAVPADPEEDVADGGFDRAS
jgi:uncharacterized ferritin-like protein (DUF455 family)